MLRNVRLARAALPCALLLLLLAGALLWPSAPAQAARRVTRVRLGSAADVSPALRGPSLFLQGNGAPTPSAFQAHINQVAGAPLDIVVLSASFPSGGSQTPECDALIVLSNVSSCETVTITSSSYASDAGATAAVSNAEIVYFSGGDQCNYVGWRGGAVYNAVKGVAARGGGLGGGSAGLAIQGDYVYDACTGSVTSAEALGNPYHRYISFTYDFFEWTYLSQVFTDSHFVTRDRMGRLMTFVARQIQDGKTGAAYGLGIDEGAVMVIDPSGLGTLYGGSAYVVLGDHTPEKAVSRTPLTFSNFKIWKIAPGGTYNFASRPTTGYYLRSVTNGLIGGDAYNP